MAKASTGSGRGQRPVRTNQTGASAPQTPTKPKAAQSNEPRQTRKPANPVSRANPAPLPSGEPHHRRPPGSPVSARKHPMVTALVPVALVVLALVALVVVKASGGTGAAPPASKVATSGSSAATSAGTSALPAGVLADVMSVSPATLAAIGQPNTTAAPTATGAKTALTAGNGKPEVLFIGAEYCPYCAAERWSVVEALSRLGASAG